MSDQKEVIEFLRAPFSHAARPKSVEFIETHGALIFLAGNDVYKIKRAVSFPYMDFSTIEKRRRAVEKEIEINRPHAPQIYIDAVPVTRRDSGTLEFDGCGEIVEWAVHMRRFAQSSLLSSFLRRGEPDTKLAAKIAYAIADFHRSLVPLKEISGKRAAEQVLSGLLESLNVATDIFSATDIAAFARRAKAFIERHADELDRRAADGFIRRCHGDLHTGNIIVSDGVPVLFDAIEFDERLARIDIFYDLAFLLMDLCHQGRQRAANEILNRYLYRQNDDRHFRALALLPLFLSLRAAIRAVVTLHRCQSVTAGSGRVAIEEVRKYFSQALDYMAPPPARLVVVGGLSGTGKSTLASVLAPQIGPAPGALLLRSDLERKAMYGVLETDRLAPETYTMESSAQVYDILHRKATLALRAGHGVIVDAVFLKNEERVQMENIARDTGVSFIGLWLEAGTQTMVSRVSGRVGDASDATPQIVKKQIRTDIGSPSWQRIDASGSIENTYDSASRIVKVER